MLRQSRAEDDERENSDHSQYLEFIHDENAEKKIKIPCSVCIYWRGVAMICMLTEQGFKMMHTQF